MGKPDNLAKLGTQISIFDTLKWAGFFFTNYGCIVSSYTSQIKLAKYMLK